VLQALWAVAAYAVASRKIVLETIRRAGLWLVPSLFVVIGLAIIIRTGPLAMA